jgi:hypothetical protein
MFGLSSSCLEFYDIYFLDFLPGFFLGFRPMAGIFGPSNQASAKTFSPIVFFA